MNSLVNNKNIQSVPKDLADIFAKPVPEKVEVKDWEKPLKKVSKSDSEKLAKSEGTKTVIVRVVKKIVDAESESKEDPEKALEAEGKAKHFVNYKKNYKGQIHNEKSSHQEKPFKKTMKNNELRQKIAVSNQVKEPEVIEKGNPEWKKGLKTTKSTTTADNSPGSSPSKSSLEIGSEASLSRRKESEVSKASSKGYSEAWVSKEKLATKLACSVSKVNIFDASKPMLGYAVRLEKDNNTGKVSPVIRLKMISYETFEAEAKESKNKIYWLPIFGMSKDFKNNRSIVFDSIVKIYADLVGEPTAAARRFEPRMALKVLLPLLVKTIEHFYTDVTSGNSSLGNASIEVFGQLYYLLGKLSEDRRSLTDSLDKEVESFLTKEERRHKRHSGDLLEFIFKLSFSNSEFDNPETMNLIFKEYLARSVNAVLKKEKSYYFDRNCPNLIERFMNAIGFSSEMLLFVVAAGKMLVNSTVRGGLEGRLGLVSEEMVKSLRSTAIWIHKNLKSKWEVLVDGLGQGEYVYNDKVMENYIMGAWNAAKNKGYLY